MAITVGRREFITLLGGTAVGWPLGADAQQKDQMRRIGVLSPYSAKDPASQARDAVFLRAMQELGWIVGRNMRIDYRWAEGQIDRLPGLAGELVAS
jgi:putative tryptophan/tyrosine transport system substrate-binding protein